MRELVRSNDPVFLSWLTATLRGAGIEPIVLDAHTAVLEGSILAIQRRVMVADADFDQARHFLESSGDGGDQAPTLAGDAHDELTEDGFLGGRLVIRQPVEGYRAAIDPVLLAASVAAEAGDLVLDVGCGVGTAGLCLAARVAGVRVRGLEVQRDLAQLAVRNVHENGLADRVDFMRGDLRDPPPRLAPGSFDHVMANPPFLVEGRGNRPPHAGKAVAAIEGEADLRAWVAFCLRMIKAKGTVTLIHRADRLDELLAAMAAGLGEITVFPLWPGPGGDGSGKPAKRVLVRGRKGVAAPLRLLPGLVLHGPGGGYTDAAEAVLRHAEELAF